MIHKNCTVLKNLRSASHVFLIILLFHGSVTAQDSEPDRTARLKNRFNLSFVAFSANKLQIDSKNDMYLNSKRTFSGELGLSYDFYQSTNFFISVGIGIGVIPFNLYFDIPPDDLDNIQSPHNDLNFHSYLVVYSSFPITINYIIKSDKPGSWLLSAGVCYSRIYYDGYQIEGGMSIIDQQTLQEHEVFRFNLADTTSRHHLNLIGELSSSWETKNGRSWTLGVRTQIGTRPVGRGSYRFTNVKDPGTGTVELGFNYVGIKTTYGFRTRAYKGKEAIRRKYKDN